MLHEFRLFMTQLPGEVQQKILSLILCEQDKFRKPELRSFLEKYQPHVLPTDHWGSWIVQHMLQHTSLSNGVGV